MILALVPVLAFGCVFVYLGNRWSFANARLLLLRSSLLFGGYLILMAEILSLLRWVTRWGLAIGWMLPVAGFAWWAWQSLRQGGKIQLPALQLPSKWVEWFLLVGILLMLAVTALVAWLAPPQTWDSLTYHMSRVAHWAQNRSVWHYATGIDRQASMSPGAETITLNFYVLSASDRLATFTQWSAMLGSLVAGSLAAKLLGAKSHGQWLAVYFIITLPIGIVESSSTITDYVVTYWVVCAVVEVLQYYRSNEPRAAFFLCLAVGLSILTKPIALPYLAPFGIWMGIILLKRHAVLVSLKWTGAAILIVGLINAGYLGRNIITYGGLSNPVDFANHSNQLRTPAGLASTLIKNVGLQAGLPDSLNVNKTLSKIVVKSHLLLGLEVDDPRTTGDGEFRIAAPVTQEDLTSNPYHFYLILASLILMLILRSRFGWLVLLYSTLSGLTLVLFSFIFKWHIFSVRYHLPFFALFGPAVGVVWEAIARFKIGYLLALLLLLASRPWLLSIDSRPLIPVEGLSSMGSILTEPRERLYFAGAPGLYDVYRSFTDDINSKSCSKIGLMLHGNDAEYLLWALLGAPRDGLLIEWIIRGPTGRYSLPDFHPCAVVCEGCEEASIRGLDLASETGTLRLYLER
ncbi:MAG TPA: hypothetical protein VJK02_09935 [Anaerolineales bacterium]|nr:hypothetical protein [Anaerolineales bacterium]